MSDHGHRKIACYWCAKPESCDCPCGTCIRRRHMRAGTACAACGSLEGVVDGQCERCREAYKEQDRCDEEPCGDHGSDEE